MALAIAEDLLALHGGRDDVGGRPLLAPMAAALHETLFCIVPRISPDGAETVLKAGRHVRSSNVSGRAARGMPTGRAGTWTATVWP